MSRNAWNGFAGTLVRFASVKWLFRTYVGSEARWAHGGHTEHPAETADQILTEISE
jgi:hypothetical protein